MVNLIGHRRYIGAAILLLLIVIGMSVVPTVPPEALTHSTMWVMKRRIHRFANANNEVPTSADQLPEIDGLTNRVRDGWGQSVIIVVEDHRVTLVSRGKDGREGGKNENTDIIGVFSTKNDEGEWLPEDAPWIRDPVETPLGDSEGP